MIDYHVVNTIGARPTVPGTLPVVIATPMPQSVKCLQGFNRLPVAQELGVDLTLHQLHGCGDHDGATGCVGSGLAAANTGCGVDS